MPKLLILTACLIAGETVASSAEDGEIVDVPKDDAIQLTRMDRARYMDKGDDPTKGLLTATKDDVDAARKRGKALAAERDARATAAAANTPIGQAEAIAAAVAAALRAAGIGAPAAQS